MKPRKTQPRVRTNPRTYWAMVSKHYGNIFRLFDTREDARAWVRNIGKGEGEKYDYWSLWRVVRVRVTEAP